MDKKKVKILLVDDQPANLLVLESVLAELGEDLVSAGSGEQALREVLEHTFAVVLLDVQMPAMNGFETAALMRRHPRSHELPIIFLTAADDVNFPVEQAYALGAVDYLTKPFNPVVLRAKVSVFIDLYRKSAEIAHHREAAHQAALKSRDERIRLILDSIRDYAFIGTDALRVITEWEGGAAEILGWDAESARGQSSDMIFTPADRAAGVPESEMRRARDTGRAEDKRWHLRRDGALFYADGVMVALRDDAGQLRGYAKILRDATAGRLAAEQLANVEAERERLYRQLEAASDRLVDIFQRAPAFMCVMRGPEHRFEIVNQRYLALVGQRALIGRTVREAMPEIEGQGFFEALDAVYASGQPFEGRNERMLLRRDGGAPLEQRFVDFVYIALRESDGAVSGVLVHGVDVTERALAGLLALGQRNALELAVSDAPLGDVLEVLAATAEEYAGGAGLAGIQLADGERARLRHAAGRSLPRAFMDALDAMAQDPRAGPGALAAASGETVTLADIAAGDSAPAYRALAAEHGLRACRAMPILAPSGAVLGVFCWYYREGRSACEGEHEALALLANTASLVIGQRHEAQERMAAENELRRIAAELSEEDHRKSEFLATLAHELRNPLAPVRTGLDLLRMAPPEPAALARVVDMMDRQLGHLIRLVNDLLDVARITRGKIELNKESVELSTLVSMALETSLALIETSRHTLELKLPAQPIVLEVDTTRIVQVLSNLLNNAAKYTPAGGRIAVAASVEAGQAVVTVSDSGVGIPEEALGTVFDMFSQVRGDMDRAQGGLGIGLSLVRRLVELHGGSVAATSAGRGHGSTFTLRLPLAGRAGRAGPDADGDPGPGRPGVRVRVVDAGTAK